MEGNIVQYDWIHQTNKQKKKDFINRMRNLHNKRNEEQNVGFLPEFHLQTKYIETYLKTKKAKVLWSVKFYLFLLFQEFDEKSRNAVTTFPKENIKEILDSLLKTDFSKVKNKSTYLMGIVRRVRNEALEKSTKTE